MRPVRAFLLTIIFLITFFCNSAFSEITVEPFGLSVFVEPEDTLTTVLTLINDGEEDVAYTIDLEGVDREEERGIPRRDDLGDVIGEFECHIPGNQYKNGCWDPDNEWFWIQGYDTHFNKASGVSHATSDCISSVGYISNRIFL